MNIIPSQQHEDDDECVNPSHSPPSLLYLCGKYLQKLNTLGIHTTTQKRGGVIPPLFLIHYPLFL